jgi:hypothetical protein
MPEKATVFVRQQERGLRASGLSLPEDRHFSDCAVEALCQRLVLKAYSRQKILRKPPL